MYMYDESTTTHVSKKIYREEYMLRPDSQPPVRFEAGRPASKPADTLRDNYIYMYVIQSVDFPRNLYIARAIYR